jgi:hypothetical protein
MFLVGMVAGPDTELAEAGEVIATGAAKTISKLFTGQIHHGVSTKIGNVISDHPSLAGKFFPRDSRYVTQAKDLLSHIGYQRWHRDLDKEVIGWLRVNDDATPEMFDSYLRGRYSMPDLVHRFPNGF